MTQHTSTPTVRDAAADAAFYAAVDSLKDAPQSVLVEISKDEEGTIVGSAAHHVLDQREAI